MPESKPKQKRGKSILYVKAASMVDMARYAYNFDFSSKSMIADASRGHPRLLVLGESIGDAIMAYYINYDNPRSFIRYTFPSSSGERESAAFADSAEGPGKHSINVLRMSLDAFCEAKNAGRRDAIGIRMGSPEDLAHAAIKRAVKEESFISLYAFEYRGKTVLCGFDLIEELMDEKKTFYYAVLKDKRKAGFAKYSYADNTFEFTDTVEEHSFIYVKIINLAEPFPFFKMPD
ncbi:MAG: hypothetical protein M1354_03570 [Candidatus Marsarchaeota archaeon]|jgi:hypothetical protein|nr:hypothetical protein [Candidatus Marsarchaeota archaeon]